MRFHYDLPLSGKPNYTIPFATYNFLRGILFLLKNKNVVIGILNYCLSNIESNLFFWLGRNCYMIHIVVDVPLISSSSLCMFAIYSVTKKTLYLPIKMHLCACEFIYSNSQYHAKYLCSKEFTNTLLHVCTIYIHSVEYVICKCNKYNIIV